MRITFFKVVLTNICKFNLKIILNLKKHKKFLFASLITYKLASFYLEIKLNSKD